MDIRLAAKWILPITSPPIEDGVIIIEQGRIIAVGPRRDFPSTDVEELGEVILTPGLVNSHTHLELSHLQGLINQPRDLVEWLLRILAYQQDLSQDELEQLTAQAVKKGIQDSLDCGVSTIGDISRFCHLTRLLQNQGPLRTVSYGEVLGIGKRRHLVEDRLRVAGNRQYQSEFLTIALSPHAPYSIEEEGIRHVVKFAGSHNMPICVHLAETVEEIDFLRTGQGRFREMLETVGVWDQRVSVPGITPVRWAHQIDLLGPQCLIAHGNYVDEEEIDLLCATGSSVAYCPRTHDYFGHKSHPLLKLMGGGVNVCVGTDSLASNPSLSILEELSVIHQRYPEMPAEAILAMGTINGARALGLASLVGSLEPGKHADLAVFGYPHESPDHPAETLLKKPPDLLRLYINGTRIR